MLTFRTMQIMQTTAYKRREHKQVDTETVKREKHISFMLTVLNIKYVACNSLFMLTTLLEIVRGDAKPGEQGLVDVDDGWWNMYIFTLFLTDMSNLLCVLHCATNWMLFYHWRINRRPSRCDTFTERSVSARAVLTEAEAALLRKMWNAVDKGAFSVNLLLVGQ